MGKHKRKQQLGASETEGQVLRPASDKTDKTKQISSTSKSSIDQIFAKAKTKRKTLASCSQPSQTCSSQPAAAPPAKTQSQTVGSKDDLFGTSATRKRRRDPEGLPIYSPEELRVGEGGGTPDCPFDCKCCF